MVIRIIKALGLGCLCLLIFLSCERIQNTDSKEGESASSKPNDKEIQNPSIQGTKYLDWEEAVSENFFPNGCNCKTAEESFKNPNNAIILSSLQTICNQKNDRDEIKKSLSTKLHESNLEKSIYFNKIWSELSAKLEFFKEIGRVSISEKERDILAYTFGVEVHKAYILNPSIFEGSPRAENFIQYYEDKRKEIMGIMSPSTSVSFIPSEIQSDSKIETLKKEIEEIKKKQDSQSGNFLLWVIFLAIIATLTSYQLFRRTSDKVKDGIYEKLKQKHDALEIKINAVKLENQNDPSRNTGITSLKTVIDKIGVTNNRLETEQRKYSDQLEELNQKFKEFQKQILSSPLSLDNSSSSELSTQKEKAVIDEINGFQDEIAGINNRLNTEQRKYSDQLEELNQKFKEFQKQIPSPLSVGNSSSSELSTQKEKLEKLEQDINKLSRVEINGQIHGPQEWLQQIITQFEDAISKKEAETILKELLSEKEEKSIIEKLPVNSNREREISLTDLDEIQKKITEIEKNLDLESEQKNEKEITSIKIKIEELKNDYPKKIEDAKVSLLDKFEGGISKKEAEAIFNKLLNAKERKSSFENQSEKISELDASLKSLSNLVEAPIFIEEQKKLQARIEILEKTDKQEQKQKVSDSYKKEIASIQRDLEQVKKNIKQEIEDSIQVRLNKIEKEIASQKSFTTLSSETETFFRESKTKLKKLEEKVAMQSYSKIQDLENHIARLDQGLAQIQKNQEVQKTKTPTATSKREFSFSINEDQDQLFNYGPAPAEKLFYGSKMKPQAIGNETPYCFFRKPNTSDEIAFSLVEDESILQFAINMPGTYIDPGFIVRGSGKLSIHNLKVVKKGIARKDGKNWQIIQKGEIQIMD